MADAYIGAETGALKGVDFSKNIFQNYNTVNTLDKTQEISRICRVDRSAITGSSTIKDDEDGQSIADESILCALVNRQLKLFDPSTGAYTTLFNCDDGRGAIKGLEQLESGKIVTCVESGDISVWNLDGCSKEVSLNAGENVCRMRLSATKPNILATGGRENALKIWDLHNPTRPIFAAKNVRNDWLNLRVPIWETDFRLSSKNEVIVACTGHQHIRLYDPRSGQRRPVYQIQWGDCPFTSVSLTPRENQVVAGNTKGYMGLFDFRGQGQSKLVHNYRGFAGSISSIECHPSEPYVASCGLDRFTRLHHLLTKEQVNKIYCKVRLNCLLLNDDLSTIRQRVSAKGEESDDAYHSDEEVDEHGRSESDDEEIWTDMRKVNNEKSSASDDSEQESDDDQDKKPPKKKKRKRASQISNLPRKRPAPSSSSAEETEDDESNGEEERKKPKQNKLSSGPSRKRARSPPARSPSKHGGKKKKSRSADDDSPKKSQRSAVVNKRKRKSIVISNDDVVKMSKMDVA